VLEKYKKESFILWSNNKQMPPKMT